MRGNERSHMDITFKCEQCGQNLVVDEAGAGETVPRPKCGTRLKVPYKSKLLDRGATPSPPPDKIVRASNSLPKTRTVLVIIALVVGGGFFAHKFWKDQEAASLMQTSGLALHMSSTEMARLIKNLASLPEGLEIATVVMTDFMSRHPEFIRTLAEGHIHLAMVEAMSREQGELGVRTLLTSVGAYQHSGRAIEE